MRGRRRLVAKPRTLSLLFTAVPLGTGVGSGAADPRGALGTGQENLQWR